MNKFISNIIYKPLILNVIVVAAIVVTTSSCSMITDDNEDCPTGLYVRFVYDYNTLRADLFPDHVGHLKLYVYDGNGRKVAERSVSNTKSDSPLSVYGYAVHFDPSELPPGHYRLQAVAMQKDWDEAAAAEGARYRLTEGENGEDLRIDLDHSSIPSEVSTRFPVEHADAPMDTLWHTLKVMSHSPIDGRTIPKIHSTTGPYTIYPIEEQMVEVTSNMATYATVSLVRDTKHLDLTLRQIDDPAGMFANDYKVEIVEPNASLGHDNAVLPGDSLLYTPYAKWTTRFDDNGVSVEPDTRADTGVLQRTAHFNIMFNRLMIDSKDASKGARLFITNRRTGAVVAKMNLAHILAQGRTAYELENYPAQEYLDREYDYHLDFVLRGDTWDFVSIVINVLGWSKRVYNVEL